MDFKETVEATPNLAGKWNAGLGALRAQDKVHLKPEETSATFLRGSVDIDTALLAKDPNGNRWDFAIGYKHWNRSDEYVYWIELHTGSDSQISVMFEKLEWLKSWLKGDGKKLATFEKEYVWVPSGATSFSGGATQVRRLAEKGLLYAGSVFKIRKNHANPKP